MPNSENKQSTLRDLTIAFAVYSLSQWRLVQEMIRRLKSTGANVVLISFNGREKVDTALEHEASAAGAVFLNHERLTLEIYRQSNAPEALTEARWRPNSVEMNYRKLMLAQIRAAENILDSAGAALLVVCEDGPGGNSALIQAARRRRIPAIVMPFGVGESKDYDNFIDDRQISNSQVPVPSDSVGAIVREHAAHWIRRSPYGDVLLHPAEFILAKIACGLDLPRPWVVQGGCADHLVVESPAMRRLYLYEGVPEEKLIDAGSIYCDAVYDSLNADEQYVRAYRSGTRIQPGRTKVLLPLPPSYHEIRGAYCEFPDYRSFVREIIASFAGCPELELRVSIHPNAPDADVEAIRNSGAQISRDWIVAEIPRHDVMLTTFSSTIRWAIASGKPVLNYDAYGFGLSTYAGVRGVLTSRSFAEIKQTLLDLARDEERYNSFAQDQRQHSSDWGQMDGNNFRRIHEVFGRSIAAAEGRRRSPSVLDGLMQRMGFRS